MSKDDDFFFEGHRTREDEDKGKDKTMQVTRFSELMESWFPKEEDMMGEYITRFEDMLGKEYPYELEKDEKCRLYWQGFIPYSLRSQRESQVGFWGKSVWEI